MLKKIIISVFIAAVFSSASYSFSEEDLAEIEMSKYGRVYTSNSLGERLNRLETDYFGMAQTGNIDSRIDALSRINSSIADGVNFPVNTKLYGVKPKNILRRLWDNMIYDYGNDGYLTGFTPSMTSFASSSGLRNENFPAFCPYDRNNFDVRRFSNRRYRNPHRHIGNSPYNFQNRLYNPYYGHNPYTSRTSFYTPPDIETKSSIHILRD